MTEPTELLRKVGAELDRIGCERFTTGSVACMIYGEPRSTNDIDIVVRLDERQARSVAAAFTGDQWYVSEAAALDAVRHGGMFNIIHVPSGLKVDLIVASNSEFNAARFSRVRKIKIADDCVEPFSSPEDVILKKLEFFRDGKSTKHLRDIASIIATQGSETLDWTYMQSWADRLGVSDELKQIQKPE